MIKIKNIFGILILVALFFACSNDTIVNPFADIDHEALALSDNDSLVKFLQNHYYDDTVDSVKTLVSGQTALYSDSKLKTLDVEENDIAYKLYVYVLDEGTPTIDNGYPTRVDSVFTKYSGRTLTGTSLATSAFDGNTVGVWLSLTNVVDGWAYGFTQFKGGDLKKDANGGVFNGPITYLNGGKGVLFIPSGLAYPSSNTSNYISSLVDTNIMFYVDLLEFVPNTDHDNDGVPSISEDVDGNGNPNDDDTDSDGFLNYFDTDDDGDGVLTIDEDANGDGNPANDFSDPNNPTLADYLNPDIF
ncbi:peptidylprolyl isomerase [uncultured Polaribacter sp.]|uniref:FKBP-type peptidyl-prolyl cis-trans isomerase n=1 Tax=uncultured Polaribacter sp. TaxID=174711 RepID=UPI002622B130|nr:peptidylprolyl isomerase [uncultured Polaribacter sp.]